MIIRFSTTKTSIFRLSGSEYVYPETYRWSLGETAVEEGDGSKQEKPGGLRYENF